MSDLAKEIRKSVSEDSPRGMALYLRAADEIDTLRAEVAFWRQDAAARLATYLALAMHHDGNGRSQRANDLRANFIMPTLAALRDADAKEWHGRCEFCGEFIEPGEDIRVIAVDDAGTTCEVHARCGDPDTPVYRSGPQDAAVVISKAKEAVGWAA